MRGLALFALLALATGTASAEKVVVPDLHASSGLVDDEAIAVTLLVRSALSRDAGSTVVVDKFEPGESAAACKRLGADHAIVGELTSDKGLRVELSIVDPAGNFDRATLRAPAGDVVGLATAIVDKVTSATRVRAAVVPPVSLGALRPYAAAIRRAPTDPLGAATELEDVATPEALAVPAIIPAIAGVDVAASMSTKVLVARAAGDTQLLEQLAIGDVAAKALLAIDRADLAEATAALVKPPKSAMVTFAQAVLAEHKGEDAAMAKAIQAGLAGERKRTMLAYASTVATRLPAPLLKQLVAIAEKPGTQIGVASRIGLAAVEANIETERAFGLIRASELDNPELVRLERAVAGRKDGASQRAREELATRRAEPVVDKPPVKPAEAKAAAAPSKKDDAEGGGISPITVGAIAVVALGLIGLLVLRGRGKNSGHARLMLLLERPADASDEAYSIEFAPSAARPATGDIVRFHGEAKRAGATKEAMRVHMVVNGQKIDAPIGRWYVHLYGAFVRNGVVRPVPASCTQQLDIKGPIQLKFDVGVRSSECAVIVTSEPKQGVEVWADDSGTRARTDARGEAVIALTPGHHVVHLEMTGRKIDRSVDVIAGQLARLDIDLDKPDLAPSISRTARVDKDAPLAISQLEDDSPIDRGSAGGSRGGRPSQPRTEQLGDKLQSMIDVDLSTPTPKPTSKSPTAPPATPPARASAPSMPPPMPPVGRASAPSMPPVNQPTNAIMDDLAMPPSITMPPPMAAAPQDMGRTPKAVTLPPDMRPPQRPSRPPPVPAPPPAPPAADHDAMRLDIGTFELDARKSGQMPSIGIDTSIPAAAAAMHDPSAIGGFGGSSDASSGIGASLASLATELDGGFLDKYAIVGEISPGVQLATDAQGRTVEIRTFVANAPVGDLAKLQHVNVARVFAHAIEGSSTYLASEHLGGDTLAHRLQTRGPMSWLEAVGLVDQVCAGVSALHGKMLAHGNIDLANIAIVDRVVKLSTPMLRGNVRDDLAAIGRVMYELLCGHAPAKPVVRPKTNVPDLPKELDNLVMALLDKNAAAAQDLRATFKKLLEF